MRKPVISEQVKSYYTKAAAVFEARYCAVLFRNRVYVATPRHLDAVNLAFAGMSEHTKRRVSNSIADGKETMLFGSAKGDGSEWKWYIEGQDARMQMYGFD